LATALSVRPVFHVRAPENGRETMKALTLTFQVFAAAAIHYALGARNSLNIPPDKSEGAVNALPTKGGANA